MTLESTIRGMQVIAKVDLDEKTKWKMGDGRPRGGAYIENERFWDLDRDALLYIMKDADTAMKANPTGRKAGKYADEVNDAHTVLGWRKKNGIKEEVDLDEARQLKDPKKEVMVSKGGKVIVIDKEDQDKYLKKGWELAEEDDSEDDEKDTEKKAKKDEAGTTGKEKIEINPTVTESAASDARRDIMKDKDLGRRKDSADDDDEAGPQDRTKLDARNVIMQLKKAADNKNHKVKFDDGKSIALKPEVVKAALVKFSKLKPNEKEKVQAQMQKSYKDMIKALTSINAHYNKEEVDLDEGKMGDQWQKGAKSVKSGPFELMRGKSGVHVILHNNKKLGDFSYDDDADNFVANMKGMKGQWVGNDIDSLINHLQKVHKEEVEIEEASAAADARRAMRRDPEMRQRAFSKDDDATDDDKKAASKNIMVQMRKAQSLGYFNVEFQDGKKIKIPAKLAIAVQQKYNAMRKPSDKEAFQAKIGKSYRDMLNALKEAVSPAQQAAIAISKKERGEKPKKESILDRIDRKIKENKNG